MQNYIKPLLPGWFEYKLLNLMPEVPEGHEFRSQVPDLENHPELWQDQCPYGISNRQLSYVEVVKND
jgi:hypothetical protein